MRPHLLAHDGLVPQRSATAPEALRPRQREQTLVREPPTEGLGRCQIVGVVGERAEELVGEMVRHEGTQAGTKRPGVLPEIEVHTVALPET